MTLSKEEKSIAKAMDKEAMFDMAEEMKAAANAIIRALQPNDGGDAYEYRGSMREVEWLRGAVDQWETAVLKIEFSR